MKKIIKCICGWEYEIDTDDEGWEDWSQCPNCDRYYKHIPYNIDDEKEDDIEKGDKTAWV